MRAARTYEDFKEQGLKLDEVSGAERWKARDESSVYDWALIKERAERYEKLLEDGDVRQLAKALRMDLQRRR